MAGEMPPGGGAGGGGTGGLLKTKLGPMPVWVWALIGLVGAWLYAKWRSGQQTAASSSTQTADTSSGESDQVAPQFVIENNLPTEASPNAPAPPASATPPVKPPPVVTPPGKGTHPPVHGKPIPGPKKPVPVGSTGKATWYKVQPGDTLSSIAQKENVKGGWQAIWKFNTTPGNREPAIIATLRSRGQNEIYPGEEFLLPHN